MLVGCGAEKEKEQDKDEETKEARTEKRKQGGGHCNILTCFHWATGWDHADAEVHADPKQDVARTRSRRTEPHPQP